MKFKWISEFNYHLLSAITLHQRKQNWNFFIFVINGDQTSISQIYRFVSPLAEKLNFLVPLALEAKSDFDHRTSKWELHSVTASERYLNDKNSIFVGSMEAPSKAFLLFFLLPDWLKFNHLKRWMECGFSDIFSRHICPTVAETIGVTNYAASFGAKNVQKTTFEAAEMMLGP